MAGRISAFDTITMRTVMVGMLLDGIRVPVRPAVLLLGCVAMLAGVSTPSCVGPEELERPVPLYGEEPIEYPLTLWDQGVEGEAVLRLRVTDTGVVDSIEVAQSSGHEGLDRAAVEGVRSLRFEPGRRNGKRVRMWATLPVQFSMRPPAPDNE